MSIMKAFKMMIKEKTQTPIKFGKKLLQDKMIGGITRLIARRRNDQEEEKVPTIEQSQNSNSQQVDQYLYQSDIYFQQESMIMQNLKYKIEEIGRYPMQLEGEINGNKIAARILNSDSIDKLLVNYESAFDVRQQIINNVKIYPGQLIVVRPPIKRSQVGDGGDDITIQEIDCDEYYIPTSGNCLFKCIIYIARVEYQYNEEQLEQLKKEFNSYCLIKKIKTPIAQAKVPAICKHLQLDIGMIYIKQNIKIRECKTKYGLVILNNHYVYIKQRTMMAIRMCEKDIIIQDKTIENCELEVTEYTQKYESCERLWDQANHCYVLDIEAYADPSKDKQFQEYSTGIVRLGELCPGSKITYRQDQNSYRQFDGSDSTTQAFEHINKQYIGKRKKNNNLTYGRRIGGKCIKTKFDVIVYAHNAGGFDSFMIMQQEGLQFQSIIYGGKIKQLKICMSECNIIILDSFCFLPKSLKKLCENFKIPSELCKGEMDHNKVNKSNWHTQELREEWEPYLKNDVLSLGYIMVNFMSSIQAISGLSVKKYISLPALAFAIALSKMDGKLYQFKNNVAKKYIRKAVHGGRVCVYKKDFRSSQLDEILQKYNCKDVEQLYALFEPVRQELNKMEKEVKQQYRDQPNSYIEKIIEQNTKQIVENKNIQIELKDSLIAFDANSLYPSAMKTMPRFPDLQTAQLINKETFDVNTNKNCYIINCDVWLPEDLKFVPVPAKINGECHYRVGHIIDQHYNDMDINQIIRFGGKVTRVYSGLEFTGSMPNCFESFINEMFTLRKEYKDQGKEDLADCIKLLMNAVYGKTVQKDILEKCKFTTEQNFIEKKYDDTIIDFHRLNNGQICYRQKLEETKKGYPSIIGCYILSYSKQIMNDYVMCIGGDKESKVYYTDTDSIYIHKDNFQTLKQNGYVGNELGQGKNDYGSGGIIQAQFFAAKVKLCYTINRYGILERHITAKGVDKEQQDIICDWMKGLQKEVEEGDYQNNFYTTSRWVRNISQGIKHRQDNMVKAFSVLNYTIKKVDVQQGIYNIPIGMPTNDKKIKQFKDQVKTNRAYIDEAVDYIKYLKSVIVT